MRDADEVKRLLNAEAERFCSIFLSNGHKCGNLWRAGNILNAIPKGNGSFVVNLSGEKIGVWFENGDPVVGTKKSGTLIDVLMAQKNLSFSRAIPEAENWLGIRDFAQVFQRPKAQAENANGLPFISKRHLSPVCEGSAAYKYLVEQRGLSLEVLRKYHVCDCKRYFTALGRETDAIAFPIYSENGQDLLNIKYLSLERGENGKKYCAQEPKGTNHLFGLSAIAEDARDIVICEGEIDAMTVAMCGFNALSVPMGAHADSPDGKENKANEWIKNDWDFLSKFERIRVCMDNDEVGKQAALTLFARLGIARTDLVEIPSPSKDPNECFALEGKDAVIQAINSAKAVDPERLTHAAKYEKKLKDRLMRVKGDYPGYDLIWSFGEHFRIRMGETSIVTGYPGHGKTTALDDLLVYFAYAHNLQSCIASLEVSTDQTLETLWRQVCGRRSLLDEHDREIPHLFEESMKFLDKYFYFFDTVGMAKIEDVLTVFEYAARRYGVKLFCLDSLMCLDVAEDDYEKQKNVMNRICTFAFRYNCHVFVVCHPKKMSEKKNAETYVPYREDISGSGHLGNLAHNVIVFHRNISKDTAIFRAQNSGDAKAVEAEIMKPDGAIYIRKQREGTGELPVKNLWFDKNSRQFRDKFEKPVLKAVSVSYFDEPIQQEYDL